MTNRSHSCKIFSDNIGLQEEFITSHHTRHSIIEKWVLLLTMEILLHTRENRISTVILECDLLLKGLREINTSELLFSFELPESKKCKISYGLDPIHRRVGCCRIMRLNDTLEFCHIEGIGMEMEDEIGRE